MSTKSEKKTFEKWEGLLAGVRETVPYARGAADLKTTLEGSLGELQELAGLRDEQRAAAETARRQRTIALARGTEAAARLRSYLKFRIGPYNDELTRYGIAPIRRGQRRRPTTTPRRPDAA